MSAGVPCNARYWWILDKIQDLGTQGCRVLALVKNRVTQLTDLIFHLITFKNTEAW
jgi:hypothetical protein